MIIIIGPSGAGKSTVEDELARIGFEKVVSYTTRAPRAGEIPGETYHYVSKAEFVDRLREGFFLESTAYNGNFYGAAARDFQENTVAVLDPVGLQMIKDEFSGASDPVVHSFCITCPEPVRAQRMKARGDAEQSILSRLLCDRETFRDAATLVDHVIENLDLAKTLQEILSVTGRPSSSRKEATA